MRQQIELQKPDPLFGKRRYRLFRKERDGRMFESSFDSERIAVAAGKQFVRMRWNRSFEVHDSETGKRLQWGKS